MDDQTQILAKPIPDGSHFFSVSLRGIITLSVVWTVCGMSIYGAKIEEPLYTLVGLCVGYYFGQGTKPKSQQQ